MVENMRDVQAAAPRTRKKKHRKPSRFAYFLLLIVAALCAAVVCCAVFLRVEQVNVTGAATYSSERIVGASGIEKGANLLRLDRAAIEKRLCTALPFVRTATVSLKLPTTVLINVTDATPRYVIPYNGKFAFTDENLKALEVVSDRGKYKGVIALGGLRVASFDPGLAVGLTDKKQAEEVKNLAAAVKKVGIGQIDAFNLSDSYQLSVVYDGRVTILLGTQTDADRKLSDAFAIIKSNIQPHDKGTLDVSTQNKRYTFSPS